MFLASKAAWAGMVCILLMMGTSGPRPTPSASEPNLSKKMPAIGPGDDVKKIQEALKNKGHYRGKVDGVFGLRTRASIRAYQKAENLSVNGQLDAQTAGKVRVRPDGRADPGDQTTKGKPSAGIRGTKGSSEPARRASRAELY